MSRRELIEKEIAALPEPQQREVYDLARFLRIKSQNDSFDGLLASETVLARDWDTPEEDAAWASLYQVKSWCCLSRRPTSKPGKRGAA